jgi:NDP-sugar pyrophosphorylase family protein
VPPVRSLNLPVLVLAGGRGTRLRAITDDRCPKPMVPVHQGDSSCPFLEFVFGHLRAQGCCDIVVCIGHLGETIRHHFGDGRRFGLHLTYDDAGSASTGSRVASAAALAQASEFLVVCGDTYHPLDLSAFVEHFRQHPHRLVQLALVEGSDDAIANVVVTPDGEVVAYDPAGVSGPRVGLETGTLAMRVGALAGFETSPDLSLTADLYPALIRRRAVIATYSRAPFFDIGTPEGYHRFSAFVAGGGATPVSVIA